MADTTHETAITTGRIVIGPRPISLYGDSIREWWVRRGPEWHMTQWEDACDECGRGDYHIADESDYAPIGDRDMPSYCETLTIRGGEVESFGRAPE